MIYISPSLSPSRALSLSLPLSSLSASAYRVCIYIHRRIICAGEYTMYACMHVCTTNHIFGNIWKLPVTTAMCVRMSQQRWSGCWPQPARLQQQVWEACKMLHSRCSDVFSEVEPILSGLKKQSKTWKDQVQKKARLTRKGWTCQHARPPGIPGRRGSMDVMAMRQAMC